MSITHNTAARTSLADAFVAAIGTNAKLKVYSGTPPANAAAALSGNTKIAEITGITFGAASSGVSTVTASTADSSAVGGVASFFRLTKSDDTVVAQGTVATSGGDCTIASTTINAGAIVSFTGTNTYTAPS